MKVIKPKVPIETQGRINRLESELENERQRNEDLEAATIELADMVAAQDDALVELAEMIGG